MISLTLFHVRVSSCVVLYDTSVSSLSSTRPSSAVLTSCMSCCLCSYHVGQIVGTTLAGCLSTWALGSLRPPSRNVVWTPVVLRVLGEPSESLLDAGSLPALRLQPETRPCSLFVPARRVVLLRDHPDLASSTVRLRAPSSNWIP